MKRQNVETSKRRKGRKKGLTPKQLAYAVARKGKGKTRRNALKEAGYRVSSEASAHALGYKLDRRLRDVNVLDDALHGQGLGPERFAATLRRLIDSEDPQIQLGALDRLGRVLGYDRAREPERQGLERYPYETREWLTVQLIAALHQVDAGADPGGPGGAGAGQGGRPGLQPPPPYPPPAAGDHSAPSVS